MSTCMCVHVRGGVGVKRRREQSETENKCCLASPEFPGASPRPSWNLDTFLFLNSKNFPLLTKSPELAPFGFYDL